MRSHYVGRVLPSRVAICPTFQFPRHNVTWTGVYGVPNSVVFRNSRGEGDQVGGECPTPTSPPPTHTCTPPLNAALQSTYVRTLHRFQTIRFVTTQWSGIYPALCCCFAQSRASLGTSGTIRGNAVSSGLSDPLL